MHVSATPDLAAHAPLSIYVHLPWCLSKCPYCDFNSHVAPPALPAERYVHALIKDASQQACLVGERSIATVFLGGGTPSLFSPQHIGRVLAGLRASFAVDRDAEVTMEANPGALERGDLSAYREAGVNRLSIGVQSFSAESLAVLGRVHGPEDAIAAVRDADAAGFESINIDLMHALPGQSEVAAAADVTQALQLEPAHISYYQLTLEPNTVFFARPPAALPDPDELAAIQDAGHAALTNAGYDRYEVSAFAKPGHECLHNLNYWRFGDYVGLGAGAHGKLTAADGRISRTRRTAHPLSYMDAIEAQQPLEQTPLAERDIGFEFMLNALRLSGGFSVAAFERSTGRLFGEVRPIVDAAVDDGLLEVAGAERWRPTRRGTDFLNDLQARFLPADRSADEPING